MFLVQLGFAWRPSVMTPTDLATLNRRQGRRVVHDGSLFWTHLRYGYWLPTDRLAPVPTGELRWPTRSATGYRVVVQDPADASTYLRRGFILGLPGYDGERLTRDRRRCVRRALTAFEYRPLPSPDVLLVQGWSLASRARRCEAHPLEPTSQVYGNAVQATYRWGKPGNVGAFVDDRLMGYMTSYAVGQTVYLDRFYLDPQARREDAGSGLYWTMLRMWSDVGVERAAVGATAPGLEQIDAFKMSMGVEYLDLPALARARPPLAGALRWMRPRSFKQFA